MLLYGASKFVRPDQISITLRHSRAGLSVRVRRHPGRAESEFKESRLRLRVLRATGYLDAQHDPLIREAYELVNIVAAMIRNSTVNEARKRLREPRT